MDQEELREVEQKGFESTFEGVVATLSNIRYPWMIESMKGPLDTLTIIPLLSGFCSKMCTNVRLQVVQIAGNTTQLTFTGPS